MKIEYYVEDKDFVTQSLYTASKSDRINKKRRNSRIRIPLVYLVLMLLLFSIDSYTGAFILFLIALLWYFLYPVWERNHYIKHYQDWVKETYKGRTSRISSVEFDNDFLFVKDDGSEAKVSIKEIDRIDEIAPLIFVKFKAGGTLLIPKDRIDDAEAFVNWLREFAKNIGIIYNPDLNWKWK